MGTLYNLSITLLTFDVVPEDGPVVVPPGADGERGVGVGLAALVSGDDLDLARVSEPRARDLEPPHAVVEQLVAASLFMKGYNFIELAFTLGLFILKQSCYVVRCKV